MLFIVKSFEILLKHSAQFFISEVFYFELIFVALTIKKLSFPLQWRLNKKILFGCIKLIGDITSAVNVVLPNSCVGPSPQIKISLFHYQYAQLISYQPKK